MISIREMTAADEGAVMEMVDRFYHSPAVEHEVDPAVLRRSFQAAVDPAEPLIQGLVLEEDGRPPWSSTLSAPATAWRSPGRTGPPGCTSGWASAIWTTSRWSLTGKKECLV